MIEKDNGNAVVLFFKTVLPSSLNIYDPAMPEEKPLGGKVRVIK